MSAHRTAASLPTPAEYTDAYYAAQPVGPVLDTAADIADAEAWRRAAVELHGDTPASQARHRHTLSNALRRTAA